MRQAQGAPGNPFDANYNPVVQELQHKIEVQRTKYRHSYQVPSTAVAMGGSATAVVTIGDDADFFVEEMTGTVYGPTDINGVPVIFDDDGSSVQFTDFPELFGAAFFDGFNGVAVQVALNRAVRGVSYQATDVGASRRLTDGYIPADLMLTPGYGYQLYRPMMFPYLARRQAKIQYEYKNRDAGGPVAKGHTQYGTQLYHYITMALHGFKLEPRI